MTNYIPKETSIYHKDELRILNELDLLFKEWHKYFINNNINNFVPDGFYPYYTKQKTKVLFIGRESRNLKNINYIDTLHQMYYDKKIGEK